MFVKLFENKQQRMQEVVIMGICPACGIGTLVKSDNTLYCDKGCGYIKEYPSLSSQDWLLDISNNREQYWKNEFFDALPTFIAHEYRRLWLMTCRPNAFCMVYQLKDVCEVLMKFPVLCAAAYLKNDAVSAKLVEKPLSLGDWHSICQFIVSRYNGAPRFELPACLRIILDGIKNVYSKNNIVNYRNEYLGHGAMGFEDNEDYRLFGENMIKEISSYLDTVLSDYGKLKVAVGGVDLTGWQLPEHLPDDAEPILHIEDQEIPLDPFIANSKKHGVLFFDYYKASQNNLLANGLNYTIGGGRKLFVAPYYCEVYGRQFGNAMHSSGNQMEITIEDSVSTREIEDYLSELNEADHFVRPEYIIDWLKSKLNDDKGSVQLLMMERGMGKTAFSYAVESGELKDFADVYACAYYGGQSGMRSDYITGINNALTADLVQVQRKEDQFVLLEQSVEDKSGNMVRTLQYFRDKYAEKRGKSKLLLIIDGVDELPVESASLFDYFPSLEDMPENAYILITSRNPQSEQLSTHLTKALELLQVSDTMRVYANENAENGAQNHAILKKYATTKIKVLDGGKMRALTQEEAEHILCRCKGTFLNLKLYAKLAESGIPANDLPELDSRELFERYLNEIKKYYGDKLFHEAMTVLYVILTAEEPLTLREVAWLSGNEFVTPKLLSFLRDFSALLRTTRNNTRGSLFNPASERYREYMEEMFPDKKAELADIFTERLTYMDTEQYKDANGNYQIPDGLLYMAAYLPTVTEDISEEIRDKVYRSSASEINFVDFMRNKFLPYTLHRLYNMSEIWGEYCEKKGWYRQQLGYLNNAGNCCWMLCDYGFTLVIRNKSVALCENYLKEEKINSQIPLATAYMNRGAALFGVGNYDEALDDLDKCIEIREKIQSDTITDQSKFLATAYVNRATTFQRMGVFDKAFRDYRSGIKLMEKIRESDETFDLNLLATAYMNRGGAYTKIKKTDEALADYEKCIKIRKSLQEKEKLYNAVDLADVFMNRGATYDRIGRHSEALRDFNRSKNILSDLQNKGKLLDPNDLAGVYLNRGICHNCLEKYDKALNDLNKSAEIREKLVDENRLYDLNDLAEVYLQRSDVLMKKGRYDEALLDINKCIEIREKLKMENKLSDWQYYLSIALRNKGILLDVGFHDTDETLSLFKQALEILEAEPILSIDAKDILLELSHLYEGRKTFSEIFENPAQEDNQQLRTHTGATVMTYFTTLIIPFTFQGKLSKIDRAIRKQGIWQQKEYSDPNAESLIADLFKSGKKAAIYTAGNNAVNDLFHSKDFILTTGKEDCPYTYRDLTLVMFSTGVGYLFIELSVWAAPVLRHLRKVTAKGVKHYIKTGRDSREKLPMTNVINRLLDFCKNRFFFTSANPRGFAQTEMIVFAFNESGQPNAEVIDSLFHVVSEEPAERLNPFKGSDWGISPRFSVWLTDPTCKISNSQLHSNFRLHYLPLIAIALHQKAAAVSFEKQINDHAHSDRRLCRAVKAFRHYFFPQCVSNAPVKQTVYDKFRAQHPSDLTSLESFVSEVESRTSLRDKISAIFGIMASIIATISLLTDGSTYIESHLSKDWQEPATVGMYSLLAFFVVFGFWCLILVIKPDKK